MPREHLRHSEWCRSHCYALSQISCRHFIYNAASHYVTRIQWYCICRASSHPTDTHAPHCAPGRTIPNAGPACHTGALKPRAPRTVIRATYQRSEHRPVKISTFRPLLIRRPLHRPSPLIAMRSDFDEWMNHPFWLSGAAARRARTLFGSRDETTVKIWISIVVWERYRKILFGNVERTVIAFESDLSNYEGGRTQKNHNVSFKWIIIYIYIFFSATSWRM